MRIWGAWEVGCGVEVLKAVGPGIRAGTQRSCTSSLGVSVMPFLKTVPRSRVLLRIKRLSKSFVVRRMTNWHMF